MQKLINKKIHMTNCYIKNEQEFQKVWAFTFGLQSENSKFIQGNKKKIFSCIYRRIKINRE